MEILLLIFIVVFLMVYSLGLGSFFATNLNIAFIIIGLVGAIITTFVLGKCLENKRRERLKYEEKQLKAIKKKVDEIKLKDDGTDIDEMYRTLKEKDIHIDYKIRK